VVIDYFSDTDLCRIPCYGMLPHRTEAMFFNCGLSVAKYQYRLLAIKNKNIGICPKKPYQ